MLRLNASSQVQQQNLTLDLNYISSVSVLIIVINWLTNLVFYFLTQTTPNHLMAIWL